MEDVSNKRNDARHEHLENKKATAMENYEFIKNNKVLQMKLISRPQEGLGTFFGTMRKIKIIYGAYSALGGGRKESNNTSTKKAKVQTCKAEMLS